jgi:hypothetical protein
MKTKIEMKIQNPDFKPTRRFSGGELREKQGAQDMNEKKYSRFDSDFVVTSHHFVAEVGQV